MGKRVIKIWDLPSSGAAAALVLLSAAFFLGGIFGCLLTDRVGGSQADLLSDYLNHYLQAASDGALVEVEWLSVLWETVRWPLLAVALGLTPLGLLGIPVLFFVRGFLLSFAIASFFRVLGTLGISLAFVVFGITGVISVPVLFILGMQGFLYAGALTGRLVGETRRTPVWDRVAFLRCGICGAALCVCYILEYSAVPVLLGKLADWI